MNDLLIIGLILAIYLAISISIGLYGRSKEDSAEDYFVEIGRAHVWTPVT